MTKALRLGTRGSQLARTQSGHVAQAIADLLGQPVEQAIKEVVIRTQGDDTKVALNESKTPGLFVNALRDALLAGKVDFIVHSFKDLPSGPVEGIALVAVPPREDYHDVLVSHENQTLQELPEGAVVGTSSPRRAAKLKFVRPDLQLVPIRGNIDTRISKVRSGEYDATILAAAGLNRIGRQDEIAEELRLDILLPAPAQGALAVECRSDDEATLNLLRGLDDAETRVVTTAERALLIGVAATCSTAVGAIAEFADGHLTVRAELSDPERGDYERAEISAPLTLPLGSSDSLSEAHQLGMWAANKLLATDLGQRIAQQIASERGGA
ncbi:MAG: hydroxymethylbilane synthase [Micrococcales bacterium]